MKKILLLLLFAAFFSSNAVANIKQTKWRWRNDNDSQTAATWKADMQTSVEVVNGNTDPLRLRIELINANDEQKDAKLELQYSTTNSDPWTTISTNDANAFVFVQSSQVADNVATTAQLTSSLPEFEFVPGRVLAHQTADNPSDRVVLQPNQRTEYEYIFKPTANAQPNATYYFRIDTGEADDPKPSLAFVEPKVPDNCEAPVIISQPVTTAICNNANATFTVASTGTGLTYQWQVDEGTSVFTNIANNATYSGVTTAALQIANASENLNNFKYRVIVSRLCSPSVTSSSATLSVNPPINAGNINYTGQPICYNTTPAAIASQSAATGGSGVHQYQWQFSTNNKDWTDIAGATAASFTPDALTQTTFFRRVLVDVNCASNAYSNVAQILVYNMLQPEQISATHAINYGAEAAVLTSATESGNQNMSYQWETSPDGTNFSPITGATQESYLPGKLEQTTYYRRVATSVSGCGSATSNTVTVTVLTRPFVDAEIPNALFPNGSAQNRTWGISHIGVQGNVKIMVLDKNGHAVFSTQNANTEWDGTYNGKPVPEDTYFYIVENQEGKKIRGSIKVIY